MTNVFDAGLFVLTWGTIICVVGGLIGAVINQYWEKRGQRGRR